MHDLYVFLFILSTKSRKLIILPPPASRNIMSASCKMMRIHNPTSCFEPYSQTCALRGSPIVVMMRFSSSAGIIPSPSVSNTSNAAFTSSPDYEGKHKTKVGSFTIPQEGDRLEIHKLLHQTQFLISHQHSNALALWPIFPVDWRSSH